MGCSDVAPRPPGRAVRLKGLELEAHWRYRVRRPGLRGPGRDLADSAPGEGLYKARQHHLGLEPEELLAEATAGAERERLEVLQIRLVPLPARGIKGIRRREDLAFPRIRRSLRRPCGTLGVRWRPRR